MKKNIPFIIFISLLIFSNVIYARNLSEEKIRNTICKEYSYVNIQGKDLTINPDDYLLIKNDGTFNYQVGVLDSHSPFVLKK